MVMKTRSACAGAMRRIKQDNGPISGGQSKPSPNCCEPKKEAPSPHRIGGRSGEIDSDAPGHALRCAKELLTELPETELSVLDGGDELLCDRDRPAALERRCHRIGRDAVADGVDLLADIGEGVAAIGHAIFKRPDVEGLNRARAEEFIDQHAEALLGRAESRSKRVKHGAHDRTRQGVMAAMAPGVATRAQGRDRTRDLRVAMADIGYGHRLTRRSGCLEPQSVPMSGPDRSSV